MRKFEDYKKEYKIKGYPEDINIKAILAMIDDLAAEIERLKAVNKLK